MGMAIAIPHYTVDDLENFPEDGNRYELLDGMLLVTPAPALSHQIVISRLQSYLSEALQRQGHAYVVTPGAVVRPPGTQLEPDILVFPTRFSPDTDWRKVNEHWLAVEVFSRSSRIYDREFKRDAYFALGFNRCGSWTVETKMSRYAVPAARVKSCAIQFDGRSRRSISSFQSPSMKFLQV